LRYVSSTIKAQAMVENSAFKEKSKPNGRFGKAIECVSILPKKLKPAYKNL